MTPSDTSHDTEPGSDGQDVVWPVDDHDHQPDDNGSGGGSSGYDHHGSGGKHGSGGGGVPCFQAGTQIKTRRGQVPIETIRTGDMVLTLDHGFQPVIWAGGKQFSAAAVGRQPILQPMVIAPDTFGPGQPTRQLSVSRQHRMLCVGRTVETHFGHAEVFASASSLENQHNILRRAAHMAVSYHHILFSGHQIIRAEGCWCESLFPGDMALSALSANARAEISRLLGSTLSDMRLARPCLNTQEARLIAIDLANHRHRDKIPLRKAG